MRLAVLAFALLAACEGETKSITPDDPTGSDADADTDADSDTDTDADSDTDTDTDTDSDTDTDTDTDTDADTDPVEEDLTGRTYAIDLSTARIVEPPGVGDFLGSYLTQPILVGVESQTETELEMIGALGVEGTSTQDYCVQTIDFPTADFSGNPDFAVGPTDVSMTVSGITAEITNFTVTGTFASDGSYFDDGVVGGSIDTRPLDSLVGDDEGAICGYAAIFGASCTACASDGEEFCMTLLAEEVYGEGVSGSIAPVAGNSCEGCESGPPAPGAECEG